jgi:hypothetical protein
MIESQCQQKIAKREESKADESDKIVCDIERLPVVSQHSELTFGICYEKTNHDNFTTILMGRNVSNSNEILKLQ